ncbi:gamma-secretase subunit Aph-1 [Nilaparvata lugens]|uniref:gamma-secretase subunit Aph-1 n=1 Tax=Nilaparvata lugens TaxID=108931 RepID=UPI00193E8D52|nr:gamma-secretase subunit Aph-1 [Nilaparvata lugens]
MTFSEFVGCTCIAYGPLLAMFVFTIMQDPIRIIILIAAAFFWLVSLLLSSIIWFILPLKNTLIFGVILSVLFQEFFRYLIYRLLRKAEAGLKKVTVPDTNIEITNNKHVLAYVAGLGFGTMSGAFALVNVLADISGPATMGLKGSSSLFTVISAILTCCFVLLHTFWGVIFFNAVDTKNYIHIGWVLGSHVLVSSVTLFNAKMLYFSSVIPTVLVMVCSGYMAFRICGGTLNRCKSGLVCGRGAEERRGSSSPTTSVT